MRRICESCCPAVRLLALGLAVFVLAVVAGCASSERRASAEPGLDRTASAHHAEGSSKTADSTWIEAFEP